MHTSMYEREPKNSQENCKVQWSCKIKLEELVVKQMQAC